MTAIASGAGSQLQRANAFPVGTPLNAFFAWNEARLRRDRRYTIARDLLCLYQRFEADDIGLAVCVSHVAIRPVIQWRFRSRFLLSSIELATAMRLRLGCYDTPAIVSARRLVESLVESVDAVELEKHAAVFKAFEELSEFVDLDALAALRPRLAPRLRSPGQRKILVIKLSALGDFVQALGPAAAIRQHHAADEITLLTTQAFTALARQSGFFDKIVIDARPKVEVSEWMALRRALRGARFDRVYDLQTSDRSSFYYRLFFPTDPPEWSGIAWRCSHPHANLRRDPQHTIDKQAEQLLMAGIHPTPLPRCPASCRPLPAGLTRRGFFLLIPGSSPRHTAKRWPAKCYGKLAQQLYQSSGISPVIIGGVGEEPLAAEIRSACSAAIDLVGRTEITSLVDLADAAAFTVGNDTGATHIAAVGGQPVVVLFSGASDPGRCAPRGRQVHVLTSPCLADLSVGKVFAQVAGCFKQPRLPSSGPTISSARA